MKPFSLEEYLKNPSQKVVTRDGREVRIICTDCKDEFPVVALVYHKEEQNESVECFYENGKYLDIDKHHLDLFFAPIKREGWVNIYKGYNCYELGSEIIYNTQQEAEEAKCYNSIATIKIEWEE